MILYLLLSAQKMFSCFRSESVETKETKEIAKNKLKVLIIGFGFVGKATYLLKNKDIEIYTYDIDPELCDPKGIDVFTFAQDMDLIFIALPTPTNIDGTCYTSLIDMYIEKLDHPFVIIRSTVPIGYCDSKRVFFMPEFLTEKNWKEDFITNEHWMFGIYDHCEKEKAEMFRKSITELFGTAYRNGSVKYNNVMFGTNKEMEMNKIIRNTFLSTKVGYFNEIYDLTAHLGIDYDQVIKYVSLDKRIGGSHMTCPGHDGKRGYGGTCFPKDTSSLYFQLMKHEIPSYLIQASMTRNERHDRKERDWLHDVNRTNVKERGFSVILVTGGAGFIGRHLCARLLEDEKNKVICLDNLVTGSEDNLAEFIGNPRFRFVKFDVKNKMFFPHIDEIYHLACIASPDKYKAMSVETLVTCFEGTKNVLDLAVVHGAKVLFTSTSEVYGDPLEHPQTETYYGNVNCVGERSCYDEGKRVAETLMYEYRRVHGLDVRIARLFNTYGPYMNLEDGRVITNFIRQVKRGEELVIYGSGNQTRSFCYVDDMIHGLLGLMHCHFEPEGALAWGPVNLGNPHCEISLNTLVDVFSLVGVSDLKVRYVEATENDPQRRKPDITKATALFGFIPSVELVDGLKRTFVANLL